MENSVYTTLIDQLITVFGKPSPLESANGVRYRYKGAYALTVYHADLAAGNSAEIAFKPGSSSKINSITATTSNPTNPNKRFNWPRVGIKNVSEISFVVDSIRTAYK